jgi:hypothetical protein
MPGFMAKEAHSEPGPKTSSHYRCPKQNSLRNSVAMVGGFPFVYPKQAECDTIYENQI